MSAPNINIPDFGSISPIASLAPAATATGQNGKKNKSSECDKVAGEAGGVIVDFVSASAFAGLGLTGSIGVFKNLRTGSSGFFSTAGGGYGLELALGLQGGYFASVNDLRGFNFNLNVTYGASAALNFSENGRLVGGSAGGGAQIGGSATATQTTLFLCQFTGPN